MLQSLPMGTLRLDYLSPWAALALFVGVGAIFVFMGVRSLAGLGPVRKWVAIIARLAVLALLVLILANAKWVRKNTDLEVMVLRDISRSTLMVTDFPKTANTLQDAITSYLRDASLGGKNSEKRAGDKIGQISFNEQAYIDDIPSEVLQPQARAIRDAGTGTNAAAAIQLALASMHGDAMHRLLLIWDGNPTAGDLPAALAAASSQNVPIDVMPLHYNVDHEVMMDNLIAPTWRQEGQPFTLEVHLRSTNEAIVYGNLSITNNGDLMPLEGGKTTQKVEIKSGLNVYRIQIPPQSPGVHQFHATIDNVKGVTVDQATGQIVVAASQLDNKSGDVFTFVRGKGQVLLVDGWTDDQNQTATQPLYEALTKNGINVKRILPDQFPSNTIEMQGYDAVILADVSRGSDGLSDEQQEMLAGYIHDTGGGLVMIGGKHSFGAGGWQGSRLEQELPVNMEIPAQRQIPKGALVLVMDPAEAQDGNYWGMQCAMKAVESLSARDEICIISFAWNNSMGNTIDLPLSEKGDGSRALAAIKNWTLGDMPDIDNACQLALDGNAGQKGLLGTDARNKHIVVITDDDPNPPSAETVQRCKDNKVSISVITVYPHNPGHVMQWTKDVAKATGGKSYGPIESNPQQLPQIFIKEASIVTRSIIQEEANTPVTLLNTTSDLTKGLDAGPFSLINGLDLTSLKNSPLVIQPMTAGVHHDPLFVHWQAGLGKSAVYTSSANGLWDGIFTIGDKYAKFWTQVVRGVSRVPVSSDFELDMSTDGSQGHITVRAVKQGNGFNNFLTIEGTVAGGAGLQGQKIRLVQTGPGEYKGDFDASQQGSYISYLTFSGQDGQSGSLLGGTTVNSSPELRDLQSNDELLKEIAERTGGRPPLPAFDAAAVDLFTRQGLEPTSSPQPIWDILIPFLLALILMDVAIRRIAWDWQSTKQMAATAAAFVRSFTYAAAPKVGNQQTLESLKRVREEVGEQKFKPAETRPDPTAKFTATAGAAVDGDISQVVGGAADKPLPAAPKVVHPKGLATDENYTGGLLAAKRRAQQKIKEREEA